MEKVFFCHFLGVQEPLSVPVRRSHTQKKFLLLQLHLFGHGRHGHGGHSVHGHGGHGHGI